MKANTNIRKFIPFVAIMGMGIVTMAVGKFVYENYQPIAKGMMSCGLLVTCGEFISHISVSSLHPSVNY